MIDELNKDIQNFEKIIEEHERLYEEHPMYLWHRQETCDHKVYADECRRIVGYLKLLRQKLIEEDL